MKKIKLIIILISVLICITGCQNKKEDVIIANSKNLHPTIFDENKIKVTLEECEYTENESNVMITLNIKNSSKNTIKVSLDDIKISDAQFSEMFGDPTSIEPKSAYDSSFYVDGEDIKKSKVSDFKKISCIVQINDNKKVLSIDREVFEPFEEDYIENGDEEDNEEDQLENPSSEVYDAYEEAKAIDSTNIEKTEYETTYNGIQIASAELQYLEDGAIYRSLSKRLEGFYMELGKSTYNPKSEDSISLICGVDAQPTWEEMKPYVDKASQVVTEENTLESVMKSFESLDCVTGEFDYSNRIFDFEITDLQKASTDLGISPKMLGYTLAMLEEYGPTVEWGDNSYQCNWFRMP